MTPDAWLDEEYRERLAAFARPEPECGELVALYGVVYGDIYDPCTKPPNHAGQHDPAWRSA